MSATAPHRADRGSERVPRLHVESMGRGPALVLLHGFALHGGLFAPLVPAFAKRHRVHVVDLPGHGHSAPIDPWTLDAVVAALERAFATQQQPLAVMGWSLGGVIALAWALAHPDRLRKLVLVGTSPRFVADESWPHAMAPEMLARFGDELRVACKLTLQRFLSLQVQGDAAGRATLAALRQQLLARVHRAASQFDGLLLLPVHPGQPPGRPPGDRAAGDNADHHQRDCDAQR